MSSIIKLFLMSTLAFGYVFFTANDVVASVILKGNRIIYSASTKEKVVEFSNNGNAPMLVQIWLDKNNPDSTPETADAPFIAMPQIFRINAQSGHALRLKFTGQAQAIPQDRESVFWFNYLQYPAIKSADLERNRLAMVIKSRLKVFYRPVGLAGDANQALSLLQPLRKGNTLTLKNPTPWHVSLRNAVLTRGKDSVAIGKPEMIPPFGAISWPLNDAATAVTLYAINDYGSAMSHTFTLSASAAK